MSAEILVPRLGWSMEEATFSAWLRKEGDTVRPGDPLFALESDKATQEVEALDGGVLHLPSDAPKPGDIVRVGQRIGLLIPPGASARGEAAPQVTHEVPALPAPVPGMSDPMTAANPEPASALEASTKPGFPISKSRAPVTPRARRVARELGVALEELSGTGRGGRIREHDVRQAASKPQPGLGRWRKAIAARLSEGARQSVPVTLHRSVDVSRWVEWRNHRKTVSSPHEVPVPSFTVMMAWLCGQVLPDHPALNARWDGDRLHRLAEIHVGIAVDTDEGLVVPVIRHANRLKLPEFAAAFATLVEKARNQKLASSEFGGGTFTVSSLGAFGIEFFTPVLNYPECAILGLGQIKRQPVFCGDQVQAQDRMALSLTFDHRALDGAPAARFLQSLAAAMESWGME